MKIGIITINMYSKGLNFACPLHTYAFQQFLLNNGIDSTVVNYKPIYFDNFDLRHPSAYYHNKYMELKNKSVPQSEKAARKKKLRYYRKKCHAWRSIYKEREVRYDKLQSFIENNYIKTDVCYDSDLLEVLDPELDCYICATDVLWKNQPDFGFDRGFFLSSKCMEQKWKIAYCASRGAYVANNQTEEDLFFHYIDDIDYISVREKSLKDYIDDHTHLDVPVVLDPVLLNPAEFYDRIITKPQEEHYLLLYYVMEKADDTIRAAVEYARKHRMTIVEITEHPLKDGKLTAYEDIRRVYHIDLGIEEWLGYIKYADCIFTNSFHACCFSILFEKNFYAGFRKNDKVTNLLQTFNLTDRSISLPPQPETPTTAQKVFARLRTYAHRYLPEFIWRDPEIDYTKVRSILEEKRTASSEFLLSAIHSVSERERPVHDYDTYKKSLIYPVSYNSRLKNMPFTSCYNESEGKFKLLESGTFEYRVSGKLYTNNGTEHFLKNGFRLEGYQFKGWNIRIRIDNRWFWLLSDGTLKLKESYNAKTDKAIQCFSDESLIPYIPVNRISSMVAEALWKKNS